MIISLLIKTVLHYLLSFKSWHYIIMVILHSGLLQIRISSESVFQDIQACPHDHIRQEGVERYHVIQKYIILGDTDSTYIQNYMYYNPVRVNYFVEEFFSKLLINKSLHIDLVYIYAFSGYYVKKIYASSYVIKVFNKINIHWCRFNRGNV